MLAARGHLDGAGVMVERKTRRRRLRDAEVLADRDLWMIEQAYKGASQDYIGRRLRVGQSLVSRRISSVPDPIRSRIAELVIRHPDGIPAGIMDRLRSALLQYREETKARDERPWDTRPLA